MKFNKLESVGWAGSALMALCGAPEAYIAIRSGTTSLSYPFLHMWFWGEVMLLTYTTQKSKEVKLLPLIVNYGLNLFFLIILFFYKIFPAPH